MKTASKIETKKANAALFYRQTSLYYFEEWMRNDSRDMLSMYLWCMKKYWNLSGVR